MKDLANSKIDKKLKDEGIDPEADKEKALEAVSEIVESSFKNVMKLLQELLFHSNCKSLGKM